MYSQFSVQVVVVAVVLTVLASVFVVLRFVAQGSSKARFAADDWIILSALITEWGAMGMTIYWAVDGGEGDSKEHLAKNPQEFLIFEKMLFAGPLLFTLSVCLIKTSIILLYKRIFVIRTFRLSANVLIAVVVAFFLTAEFGTIFANHRVQDAWEKPNHKDINYAAFLLATAVINMILDLTILIMPLFVIRSLQMSFQKKMVVLGIFWLGIFCVIASAVRIYYFALLVQGKAVKDENTFWSFIEPCASIIAACLPTLAPLFHENRTMGSIIRSARSIISLQSFGQQRSSKDNTQRSKDSIQGREAWQRLTENSGNTVDIGKGDSHELSDMESSGAIKVEHDFTTSESRAL